MCWALIRRNACGAGDVGGVAGGLAGTEIAAIAEHGEQVARSGLRELRVGAGGRPEVAGVARPVCGIFENVEQVALRHASVNLRFEGGETLGRATRGCCFRWGLPSASMVSAALAGKPASTAAAIAVEFGL